MMWDFISVVNELDFFIFILLFLLFLIVYLRNVVIFLIIIIGVFDVVFWKLYFLNLILLFGLILIVNFVEIVILWKKYCLLREIILYVNIMYDLLLRVINVVFVIIWDMLGLLNILYWLFLIRRMFFLGFWFWFCIKECCNVFEELIIF